MPQHGRYVDFNGALGFGWRFLYSGWRFRVCWRVSKFHVVLYVVDDDDDSQVFLNTAIASTQTFSADDGRNVPGHRYPRVPRAGVTSSTDGMYRYE